MNPKPPLPKAKTEHGVSLWQDGWRRLRKNGVAMASLWLLGIVVLLALVTPILPLAPPDFVQTELMLTAPDGPFMHKAFPFDPERLAKANQQIAGIDAKLATAEPSQRDQLESNRENLIQRPYTMAGYPELGLLSRGMVRARYALFGEWQLGPWCGRDRLGRDLMSRIFWGARISLMVGLVATLVSLVIGVTYGLVSGYLGGSVDNAMMRIVDVLYSVPFIFVVIFIISVIRAEEWKAKFEAAGIDQIVVFFAVVGAIYWLTMARVVRGQTLAVKNEPYVESARALGVSQTSIIFRHILPNLFSVVLVYLTLTIPRVILFESFLSFLGMGVEPPNVSWGVLANQGIEVITPVKVYWWLIVFPSLALGMTLFALNFLGDGLRDALDPKLRDR